MTHVNATSAVKSVDQLKREFQKIVDRKNPILLQHRTERLAPGDKEWNDAYYCYPNTNQSLTLEKRVNALAKHQPELFNALAPLVVEAKLAAAAVIEAKESALKNRNAKKAAAVAKAQEKDEIKRNPYHKLHPEVAALLKQVAEPYRLKAVEAETNRQTHILEEVKRLADMFGSFDPAVLFPTKQGDRYHNEVAIHKRMVAQPYIDCDRSVYHNPKWSLIANPEGLVASKAKQFAEDMVTAFIHKVGTKLSGIVEKKSNLAKTFINGSLQDHWMTFEFADGATFQVQSQIVWKTSVNGVHFAQYPTCFRNVKLAGGAKMELPSEAKMKEAFV